MPVSRLTAFQRELLREFTSREPRFFVTGGAALTGFYLGHRETDDLDFATFDAALSQGVDHLAAATTALGAEITEERLESASGPETGRRRFHVRRGDEQTKVDLLTPDRHGYLEPNTRDGIAVDRPEQILVNKLVMLAAWERRQDPRDLVDIRALEQAGYRIDDAAQTAQARLGFSPAVLASYLREWRLGPDTPLPQGLSPADLEAYRRALIDRLTRMAFPRPR